MGRMIGRNFPAGRIRRRCARRGFPSRHTAPVGRARADAASSDARGCVRGNHALRRSLIICQKQTPNAQRPTLNVQCRAALLPPLLLDPLAVILSEAKDLTWTRGVASGSFV